MHAYGQPVPAAGLALYRCRPVSAAGRRFITGTAIRIPIRISLQTEYFVPGFGDEKLSPGSTPRQTSKRKVGRKIRRRRLRVECVCVRSCVAAKIYRKANCTPSTAARDTARDVSWASAAALFNRSLFPTLRCDQHADSLKSTKIFMTSSTCKFL